MLGGGSTTAACPSKSFIQTLSTIGDEMSFTYPLGNFTCTFFMKATCGAPAFKVVENGAKYEDYEIYYEEYDNALITTTT